MLRFLFAIFTNCPHMHLCIAHAHAHNLFLFSYLLFVAFSHKPKWTQRKHAYAQIQHMNGKSANCKLWTRTIAQKEKKMHICTIVKSENRALWLVESVKLFPKLQAFLFRLLFLSCFSTLFFGKTNAMCINFIGVVTTRSVLLELSIASEPKRIFMFLIFSCLSFCKLIFFFRFRQSPRSVTFLPELLCTFRQFSTLLF